MPWNVPFLRDRRRQVRDDIDASLPGADARVPNAPLSVIADAQASLTNDNDAHLEWVARQMMPDSAEGEFAERWGNIWLAEGRKPATYSSGFAVLTGTTGSIVPTGAEMASTVIDDAGNQVTVLFQITAGGTLSAGSATLPVEALDAGAIGNLEDGASLFLTEAPAGVDGTATVAAPGLAGGADIEPIEDLRRRYINRIQEPPHGGNANDWVQWVLAQPGVTRAWGAQEMGVGTYSVRFMLDEVRAEFDGLPQSADITAVTAALAVLRPVTVAQTYLLAPVQQIETVTIDNLIGDTPEVRTAIRSEIDAMLFVRARPGATISASWVREAISAATGEDRHDVTISNLVPASAGHMIFIDIEYA